MSGRIIRTGKDRPASAPGRDRLSLLDTLRGILIIGMIAYHAAWDLVFLCGHTDYTWFFGRGAYLWERTVCIGFIFLSGLCTVLSRKLLRRGIIVSLCGGLVMLVTHLLMPGNAVTFGVLTMIGASMIITAGIRKVFSGKVNAPAYLVLTGAVLCIAVYALLSGIPSGYIGITGHPLVMLPRKLYANLFTAFFGFMPAGFSSTDYFPMLPWYFVFAAGALTGKYCYQKGFFRYGFFRKGIGPLSFLGRHSLLIYLLHQPVLYVLLLPLTSGTGI
ncbi:MAG: DUF1624 domain-containing protein [Clostridia bacterium]|nr:DUF1624 domain-containing protein [Clostridia bacterium]